MPERMEVPTGLIVEAILAACPQLHPVQARMAARNVQKVITASGALGGWVEQTYNCAYRGTPCICREERCGCPYDLGYPVPRREGDDPHA